MNTCEDLESSHMLFGWVSGWFFFVVLGFGGGVLFWFFFFAYLSVQQEASNASPGKLLSASSCSFQRVALCVIGLLVLIIATIMERLAPCFKYTISCNSHSRSRKFLLLLPCVLDGETEAPNRGGFCLGPQSRYSKEGLHWEPSLHYLCAAETLTLPGL